MEISASDLKARLDRGDEIALLDIRKSYELEIAQLENAIHIPEDEIEARLDELRAIKDKDIVVFCRTGRRSSALIPLLESRGLKRVLNLTGGLHAWSDDVDPSIMKY